MIVNKACAVYNLKLVPNEPRVIFHDYALSDEKQLIIKYLSSPEFINNVGQYSYTNLFHNTHFFTSYEANENDDLLALSNHDVSAFQELINFLWFIRDNSCNILTHFTYMPQLNHGVYVLEKSSNYTSCTGAIKEVLFSKEEILKAANILFTAHGLSSANKNIDTADFFKIPDLKEYGGMSESSINKIHYGLRNRVERAILFLGMMRNTPFIPLKIALGMNILECLFSDTEHGDIIHKIAERTALYIGEDKEECLKYFRIVKKAYDIRSKYFHGQKLEIKEYSTQKLEEQAKTVDDLLRIILTKVIMVDSAVFINNKQLTDWFNEMIFTKDVICPRYIFK